MVEPFYVIGLPLLFSSPVVVRPYEFRWFDVELPNPGPYDVVWAVEAMEMLINKEEGAIGVEIVR